MPRETIPAVTRFLACAANMCDFDLAVPQEKCLTCVNRSRSQCFAKSCQSPLLSPKATATSKEVLEEFYEFLLNRFHLREQNWIELCFMHARMPAGGG